MDFPQPVPAETGQDTLESACDTFKSYLAMRGLRVTSQRLAIFEAAFNQGEILDGTGKWWAT